MAIVLPQFRRVVHEAGRKERVPKGSICSILRKSSVLPWSLFPRLLNPALFLRWSIPTVNVTRFGITWETYIWVGLGYFQRGLTEEERATPKWPMPLKDFESRLNKRGVERKTRRMSAFTFLCLLICPDESKFSPPPLGAILPPSLLHHHRLCALPLWTKLSSFLLSYLSDIWS